MEMVGDYAYVGTDFLGHPDMVLPPGELWNMDLGEFQKKFVF